MLTNYTNYSLTALLQSHINQYKLALFTQQSALCHVVCNVLSRKFNF